MIQKIKDSWQLWVLVASVFVSARYNPHAEKFNLFIDQSVRLHTEIKEMIRADRERDVLFMELINKNSEDIKFNTFRIDLLEEYRKTQDIENEKSSSILTDGINVTRRD